MWYIVVFFACLLIDSIPIFAPPAWTAMVFLQIKFDLNIWIVLVMGVLGSTLGRLILSTYIPKISEKIMKQQKTEDLVFLGTKLSQSLWKSWLFVFLYTLSPLSTTALFTAAGLARVPALQILPPFFVGKFISDAVVILTGDVAHSNFSDWKHALLSWKFITAAVLGILLVGALLFIDWKKLLQTKKLSFKFKIFK